VLLDLLLGERDSTPVKLDAREALDAIAERVLDVPARQVEVADIEDALVPVRDDMRDVVGERVRRLPTGGDERDPVRVRALLDEARERVRLDAYPLARPAPPLASRPYMYARSPSTSGTALSAG